MRWQCNTCLGTYDDTLGDGSVYAHVCGVLSRDALDVAVERPNKRNETIALDRQARPRDIISPGAGVTPIDGQKHIEPQWIIDMRAQYALAIEKER